MFSILEQPLDNDSLSIAAEYQRQSEELQDAAAVVYEKDEEYAEMVKPIEDMRTERFQDIMTMLNFTRSHIIKDENGNITYRDTVSQKEISKFEWLIDFYEMHRWSYGYGKTVSRIYLTDQIFDSGFNIVLH